MGSKKSITAHIPTDYDISIGAVLSEAWHRVKGSKAPIWGATGLYLLLSIALGIIAGVIGLLIERTGYSFLHVGSGLLINLVVLLITMPIVAGILYIGIKRSLDQPIKVTNAFIGYGYTWRIFWAVLMISIILSIGLAIALIPYLLLMMQITLPASLMLLFVLCGLVVFLYFAIGYMFVFQLIIDQQLGPWQAMEVSRRTVNMHWFSLCGLSLIKLFILFVSAIPLGIGLIWTVPMVFNSLGVLYRNVWKKTTSSRVFAETA